MDGRRGVSRNLKADGEMTFGRWERGRAREPIFNLPGSIVALIAIFCSVHVIRVYGLDDYADARVLQTFAFVPGQFTFFFDPDAVAHALTQLAAEGSRMRVDVAQFFLGDGSLQFWTPVTYAFLHADWTHLGVNSLWLAAFGSPVAARFGAFRFLGLFLVTAVAGAGAHYAVHGVDLTPVIGASASVSGATAAALRFVFQPGAPLGPAYGGGVMRGPLPPHLAVRRRALPLGAALRDRHVIQFTLIWFAINLAIGVLAVPLGIAETGVAWEAHAGGFIAGFLLFHVFDPIPPNPDTFITEED